MARTAHVPHGSAVIKRSRSSLVSIPAPHSEQARTGGRKKSNLKVKVADQTYQVSEVFEAFFWFVCERHRVFLRRLAGHAYPWTEDKILSSHPFVNVFRVYDKNTQYILQRVIGEGFTLEDAFFRVVLFRMFNKIQTWELLEKALGPLTARTFDITRYDKVLTKAMDSGVALYSAAYIMPAPPFGYPRNHSNHLRLLDAMMSLRVHEKLTKMQHLKDAHGYITLFPSMGEFMAMQLVLDLNMLPFYDWNEDEWVALGPGSRSCLIKMFGKGIRGDEEAAIRCIRDNQFQYFQRFGLTANDIPQLCDERGPGLTMVDIEHALCECEKYSRAAYPHIKGRRINPGKSYVPSNSPVTAAIPAKWRVPRAPRRWEEPDAVDGDDSYEVSHIVKEDKGKTGTRWYHIRWAGWGPEHDSVLAEYDLGQAEALLTSWKALKEEIGCAMEERTIG